jgi:hypothetical protein
VTKTAEERREGLLAPPVIDGWSVTQVATKKLAMQVLCSAGFTRVPVGKTERIPTLWAHGSIEARIMTPMNPDGKKIVQIWVKRN